jgi:hypothetical protein
MSDEAMDMTAIRVKRFKTVVYAIAVSLAATTISACVRRVPGEIDQREQRADASVRVENRAFTDMTIYIVHQSQRVRLGTVSALTTTTFPIPRQFVSGASVRFVADPLGSSRAPVSEEISVSPGDEIVLVIPAR